MTSQFSVKLALVCNKVECAHQPAPQMTLFFANSLLRRIERSRDCRSKWPIWKLDPPIGGRVNQQKTNAKETRSKQGKALVTKQVEMANLCKKLHQWRLPPSVWKTNLSQSKKETIWSVRSIAWLQFSLKASFKSCRSTRSVTTITRLHLSWPSFRFIYAATWRTMSRSASRWMRKSRRGKKRMPKEGSRRERNSVRKLKWCSSSRPSRSSRLALNKIQELHLSNREPYLSKWLLNNLVARSKTTEI